MTVGAHQCEIINFRFLPVFMESTDGFGMVCLDKASSDFPVISEEVKAAACALEAAISLHRVVFRLPD